jgi:NAD(P)-dependent dehydrogenase (short-subunit alcohol dehydrogenase family)
MAQTANAADKPLTGRVAAVTGGGSGLGRAIADALVAAGADVALLEIDAESGARSAAELAEQGVATRSYEVDVSQSRQVDEACAAVVDELGGLDVFVNNAGISRVGPPTDQVTDEDWLDSIAVMQTGVFYGMRAAGRIMIERGGGAIVNIASIRGFSPNPGRIMYCAPKAAVIMMTKVAAGEWGPHGVRVNAVAPGFLRTPMWDRDVAAGTIDEDAYVSHIPAGRLGRPAEVGDLIVYLASDRAEYVNGACLTIDGATTALPAA